MSFGKLALGVLLLAVGALFLAIQLGYAPPDTAAFILPFWPLLLVAFGLALLASAIKNSFFGWLAAALILGGVAYAVYMNAQRHARGEVSQAETEIDLAKLRVRSVTVRVRAFAGAFAVGGSPAKSRSLEFAVRNVRAEAGGGHRFVAAGSAGIFEWPRRRSAFNLAPIGADADLRIPQGMPVRLDCRGKLASMRFDLSRLRPELCSAKGFASSLRIDLGETGHPEEIYVRGVLTSARIRIPADCPVRLVTHSRLATQRLPSDFVEHAVGRGKERLFTADGRGRPVRIRVEGLLLDLRIERAPLSAV
jgi:hypothetical protein